MSSREGEGVVGQDSTTRKPKDSWWSGTWTQRLPPAVQAPLLIGNVVVFLLLWELLTGNLELVNPIFLPPPSRIADGLASLFSTGEIYPHIIYTARNFAVGFGLAASTGVIGGMAIGLSRLLFRLSTPLLWALYAMPWVAIRPLASVWFGFGAGPVIFIVWLASFFVVILTTAAGVKTVDPALLRAGRVFGGGPLTIFGKIIFPSIVPYILTGLQHGVILGMIGVLVAEMLGAPSGLGMLIVLKTATFSINETFAVLLVAVTASVTMRATLKMVAMRLTPWQV